VLLHHITSTNDGPTLDVDSQDSGTRNTPLHLAAQTYRADIVRLLFEHGANALLKNRRSLTPFHQCVLSGDLTGMAVPLFIWLQHLQARKLSFYSLSMARW
jgi:ankyrin repeat protein